jgi:uncharacterized protein (DUF885 family)
MGVFAQSLNGKFGPEHVGLLIYCAIIRAMKQAIVGLTLVFSLFGQAQTPTANIDDFFRDFTAQWVRGSPNLATSTRYFTGDEQDRLERQLTPETTAYKRERIRLARQGLAEIAKFDRSKLSEAQRLSADVMQWQLETVVGEEPYLDFTFALEQMNGANIRLVETMTVRHPVLTEKDAESYLAALGQVSTRMAEAVTESRRQAAKGFIPPAFIVAATVKQMQGFIDGTPSQNPFVTAYAQKLTAIAALPASRREELRAQAERITASQIYPEWKKAIAWLQAEQKRASIHAGLWRFTGGAGAYAYFLHRYTTTNLSADQIHQIGLGQVTSIEGQMDTLLRRLGRTAGPVKERIAKLAEDMRYPDPASEASRAQIMQDIEKILRVCSTRVRNRRWSRKRSPVSAKPMQPRTTIRPRPTVRVRELSSFPGVLK